MIACQSCKAILVHAKRPVCDSCQRLFDLAEEELESSTECICCECWIGSGEGICAACDAEMEEASRMPCPRCERPIHMCECL